MMKPVLSHLVLASILATAGVSALAQHNGGTEPQTRASAHHMRPEKMHDMEKMHAQRGEALKAKLKITAAQEGAWATFSDAMKPPARPAKPAIDHAELAKLSTPERLDKMKVLRTQHMTERNAAMEQRDTAVKNFYATLSGEQKKVFDAEFAAMKDHHGDKQHH